jgi:hypothetical protein
MFALQAIIARPPAFCNCEAPIRPAEICRDPGGKAVLEAVQFGCCFANRE